MKTLWQTYCDQWKDGCGAPECGKARSVVHARGQLPCDVLFLGEAPGESEDVLGRPFCGPAGRLLEDAIVNVVLPENVRRAYTNLVGCVPREEGPAGMAKAAEPLPEQIKQCRPRLIALVEVANPRLLICVGKMATDWLEPGGYKAPKFHRFIPHVSITHPAAILRANVSYKGLMIQKAQVILQTAAEEYLW